VKRLRRSFPNLTMIVNGGLRDSREVVDALHWSDGVILGREAYHRPQILTELREILCAGTEADAPSREELIERMVRYAERETARGTRLSAITRHMLGLYGGEPGAREYRRLLSEGAREEKAGPELLRLASRRAGARAESSAS